MNSTHGEWRCTRCKKLLGKWVGTRVQIRFSREKEYMASAPIVTDCRCGVRNEISPPNSASLKN